MKRQISFQQYRTIDLCFLVALLGISEGAIHIAKTTVYASQLWQISTTGCVTALVMMRWSGWAAIPAALGGLLYAALKGSMWQHFLVYGLGNLLCLAALVWFKLLGKEKVRKDPLLTIVFGLSVQLLMQLGRAGIALALGYPADTCFSFITADALSLLFTAVAVWIMRRIEGLFEDQKSYLLRIQQERQVEGREQF